MWSMTILAYVHMTRTKIQVHIFIWYIATDNLNFTVEQQVNISTIYLNGHWLNTSSTKYVFWLVSNSTAAVLFSTRLDLRTFWIRDAQCFLGGRNVPFKYDNQFFLARVGCSYCFYLRCFYRHKYITTTVTSVYSKRRTKAKAKF
jgi:hypothetical protein